MINIITTIQLDSKTIISRKRWLTLTELYRLNREQAVARALRDNTMELLKELRSRHFIDKFTDPDR
jgi:hypothetical protein